MYNKISQALTQHLSDSEKAKVEVTEEDLIKWYTKQNKGDFASETEGQRTNPVTDRSSGVGPIHGVEP